MHTIHCTNNKPFAQMAFPKLERYIEWMMTRRKGPSISGNDTVNYLLYADHASEVGMDHEQSFCPGNTYWDGKCTADHYALDFVNYIIYECQALAKLATIIGLDDRSAHWRELGVNVTEEMNRLMQNKKYTSLKQSKAVISRNPSYDVVIIGVLYNKTQTKTASNGSRFITWQLTDLEPVNSTPIHMQLFGKAYDS